MTSLLNVSVLAELEPISSFSPARLRELLDYCRVQTINQGIDIFEDGSLRSQTVYLVSGEIEVRYEDGNKVVFHSHSEWSKHPLGKRQPYVVSAKALRRSQLVSVDEELLDRMVTLDQLARNEMREQDQQGGEAVSKVNKLLNSSMFRADNLNRGPLAHLPMANITTLLQRLEPVVVWAGDVVIREGDEGDYYYLIDSGHAAVTRFLGGVDVPLAELGAGDVFGEEALVSGAQRNASVTMRSNGVLLRLGRQDFFALLQEPLLHKFNYEQAERGVADGMIWLDVRHPSEYRHDRLPGAINVPLGEIRDAIDVLERGSKYIAYCQSGRRSAAAAFILAQAGYDIGVLSGGLWAVPKTVQSCSA